MPSRRSKLDIVLIVLKAVRKGMDKPTRIMYAANLSWKPTQRILDSLVEQRLLNVTLERSNKRNKKRYTITERGNNVIDYFQRANEFIDLNTLTLE